MNGSENWQQNSPWRVVEFDSIPSTMDAAKDILKKEKPSALAVIAKTQTAGRGRRGAEWRSPIGGFYVTFGFSAEVPVSKFSALSLAVGVSLIESLQLQSRGVGLKWPNDLIHQHSKRKLGGILIELLSSGDQSTALIGIGINMMKQNTDESSIGLEDLSLSVTRSEVARVISSALYRDLELFLLHGFSSYKTRWESLSVHQCATIKVDTGSEIYRGSYEGIDEQGALLLKTPIGISVVQSGHLLEW